MRNYFRTGVYRKTGLICALFLLLCIFVSPLSGQTAQRMEALLEEEALSWSDAAIFVLEAADWAAFSNPVDAFYYARERNWLPKNAQPQDTARLNGISLLLMQAFELPGGIFYSLTKNSHYAYRELVYKEVILGRADPHMLVSGDDFLFMIGRILTIVEESGIRSPWWSDSLASAELDAQTLAEYEALAEEINVQLANVSDADATVTSEGVTIRLSQIQFLPNSTVLADTELVKIREIAAILGTIPARQILVSGHTALAGTREDRQQTSLGRAQAVANELISLGARTASEINVYGFGSERPIADNRSEQGMAANRRVEITIIGN